jgi:hypothetical protein
MDEGLPKTFITKNLHIYNWINEYFLIIITTCDKAWPNRLV